jgi:hypothetical protein
MMHRADPHLTAHSMDNFARPAGFIRGGHRHVINALLIERP